MVPKQSDNPTQRTLSRHWLCGGLLVLSCIVAYSNSFDGVLLFDDNDNIVHNKQIRSFKTLWIADDSQLARGLHRRPVVNWSLALNYAFGELNPWGYHVFNLLVHTTAALLLFGIVHRSLQLPGMTSTLQNHANGLAFTIALFWAVHPLQTESVTYVVQRCESLMGMFYLATLYCAIRGATARHSLAWYIGAVFGCSLGMGCKEVMITAPIVVLLYDRAYLSNSWLELMNRRAWLYAGFAPATICLLMHSTGAFIPKPPEAGPSVTIAEVERAPTKSDLYTNRLSYLASQPAVILHYLKLAFLPTEQCLDYLWPVSKSPIKIAATGTAILAMIAMSFYSWHRSPRLGFLGLTFFLILAPTSSIIPLNLAYEHRMYLSLACVVTVTVLAANWLLQRWTPEQLPILRYLAVGTVALTLILLTYSRNFVYHSELAMWGDVIAKAPHNPRGYNHYGWALLKQGHPGKAEPFFNKAVELMPHFWTAHQNLAAIALHRGDWQQAIDHATTASQLRPSDPEIQARLVQALNAVGQFAQAENTAREFIASHSKALAVQHELGNTMLAQGDTEEAKKIFHSIIEQTPTNAESHYSLGLIHQTNGDWAAATEHYELALQIEPRHAQANNNLGWIYQQQDKPDVAMQHFAVAIASDPTLPQPLLNAGNLLLAEQNFDAATRCFTQALHIDGQLAEARRGLALARQRSLPNEQSPTGE